MKVVKSFVNAYVGISLLPHLNTGVGGAAGTVANLSQTFYGLGLLGNVAKGVKKKNGL